MLSKWTLARHAFAGQSETGISADRLLQIVVAVAKEARPNVEPHAGLDTSIEKELGLDSLARVELVLRLEKEFGVALPEQALATSETPRDLLRFLLSSAGQAPRAAAAGAASVTTAPQGEGVRAPSQSQAQTLTEALEYHVERQPDRLTVFMYEERNEFPLSYRALWDGAMGYAAYLAQAGCRTARWCDSAAPARKTTRLRRAARGAACRCAVSTARLTTIGRPHEAPSGDPQERGRRSLITITEAQALADLLRRRWNRST